MPYNPQKHYRALELDKVLEMLTSQAVTAGGKALARNLTPAGDFGTAQRWMNLTEAAHRMCALYGDPTIVNVKECGPAIQRASLGSSLSLRELLDVGQLLRGVRLLYEYKQSHSDTQTALDFLFQQLVPHREVEDALSNAILSEEELSDAASPELASIRRKIRNAGVRIREQLEKLIRSPAHQKHLQEQIITQRDGRYVVPVKNEYRGEIKGLIHDTSSSGATVFVEPMAVVEANNEIRLLQSQEKKEVERIIAALSALVGSCAADLLDSYDLLIHLDLHFAKAKLAYQMKATVPQLTEDHATNLKRARHPLIPKEKIVPIDLYIGEEFDTLVITGPNTGGKTVAIKTLGLMTLMAMCGLMLPVEEGSKVSFFRQVAADIGDEQSIEQSLSTFSSHMVNIVSILNIADGDTLVLLDELGAGTDPVEGAALAVSIIEHLRAQGARILATTHYAEIKMYALKTPGVENASCEFDVQSLRPTYRLLIGVPGRSNAFAIGQRLGIQDSIIQRAKELVSTENIRFEDVVGQLESSRQELEREKDEIRQLREQARQAQQEAQRLVEETTREKEREIDQARKQARQIVEQVTYQSNRLMNELEEIKKQKDSERFGELTLQARQKLRSGVRKIEDAADPVIGRTKEAYQLPRKLKRGDPVRIVDINKEGTVLSEADANGYVLVQAGIIKTRVPLSNLRLLDEKAQPKVLVNSRRVDTKKVRSVRERDPHSELDLRGMTVEEALLEVDQFIDNAVLTGLPSVTLIHGKGTGALRKAVQEHLRHHPNVRTYRLGTFGEGESGVTIAELK